MIGAQVTANQCTFSNERLAPAPLPHAPPPSCPPKPREQALREGAKINAALARVVAKFPDRAQLLIPADIFCGETCATVKDGTWLYLDVGHFNVVGSRYAITRAQPMLVDLLRN
ncbi:putative acyltransferase [Afipia carboxidovorans OM5]|nr:putative acyltransferase [Afipia carboxidovorans OM5]